MLKKKNEEDKKKKNTKSSTPLKQKKIKEEKNASKRNKEKKEIKEENVREVIVERKTGFSTIEVTIIIVVAILFGALVGSVLTYTKEKVSLLAVPEELEELVTTYDTIIDTYYDTVDKEELLDSAIKGMINHLDDPYTVFMDEESTDEFNQTVEGEYVGIGATVAYQDGKAVIISMFENSPSEKAGLKERDIITKVEGESVENKSLSEITDLIKGKAGTKVKITIIRDEKEEEVVLTRGTVEIPSVTKKTFTVEEEKIGYLQISIFASNTYKQFKKELKNLEKENIDGLIIDVRGNPGGHLNQVTDMLSLFMPKSKILYQIKNKGIKEPIYSTTKEKREYPIVVLQDKNSASASEILSSAIKESYKGTIVGTTSYGKGTVQKAYTLSSGASFKYTTEEWLTPSGKSINEVGVKPDIEVELNEEYQNNPSDETDNQLQAALDTFKK